MRTQPLTRRAAAACMTAALSITVVAATATTSAAASASLACTGDSVIVSMPLKNAATGQSNWSWGYVQLWYNYCTSRNWGRIVSLLPHSGPETVIVYNNALSHSPWASASGTILTSASIPSPNNPAGAFGLIETAGGNYYAESDQSGANCTADVFPSSGSTCSSYASG